MARPDWRGVERALTKRNLQVSAKATVERNSTDVAAALATMLAAKPEVVIMISAYASCAEFIKQAKAKQLVAQFVNVSFVGTRAGACVGASSRRRHDFPGHAAADGQQVPDHREYQRRWRRRRY